MSPTWTKVLIVALVAPLLGAILWMIQVAASTQVKVAQLEQSYNFADKRLTRIEEKVDVVIENQQRFLAKLGEAEH